MKRLVLATMLGTAALLAVGIVAANGGSHGVGSTVSPRQLAAAGWSCVNPGYWVHCTPPGIDIAKAPPVIVSLNFYTIDPRASRARFLGFEDLIRADIWKALPRRWPCEQGAYRRVPGTSLPNPGYMYCHHFDDKLPLPKR